MRIHDEAEAYHHLREWYLNRIPAGADFPTISTMRTMPGFGGWVFRADFDGSVTIVQVGPRGGFTWIVSLTDEQIAELR